MSVFNNTCDFCGDGPGLALRCDMNFGWICGNCCGAIDRIRADDKAANPDGPHRWRPDELPAMQSALADRRRLEANQRRRIARTKANMRLSVAEARRIIRKHVSTGTLLSRLARNGKFYEFEWAGFPAQIRYVDGLIAGAANAADRKLIRSVRDAAICLYDPADRSRIRAL